jgi:hypothetical protein
MARDIMHGKVAGYRRQGKPRMRWLDSIKEACGVQMDALKAVLDRQKWLMLVEEKTRNGARTNVK